MSNIDKAGEVLEGYFPPCEKCRGLPDLEVGQCQDCAESVAHIARDLADAGLLAPDLPAPDKDSPFPGTSWQVYKEHGGVYVVTSRLGLVQAPGGGGGHSPAEARAIADALYAAAAHAEKETQ